MKSIHIQFFILTALISSACNSGNETPEFEQTNKTFFPVHSFIKSELAEIDSLPIAVFRYVSREGKTDTSIIEKNLFRSQTEEFIQPDITTPELKDLYRETVFQDNSINAITLSYVPKDQDAIIRKIDVYVNPDNEKVKYIYIEKSEDKADSNFVRKMIWTAGKHFQVSTVISVNNRLLSESQEKYSWGFE